MGRDHIHICRTRRRRLRDGGGAHKLPTQHMCVHHPIVALVVVGTVPPLFAPTAQLDSRDNHVSSDADPNATDANKSTLCAAATSTASSTTAASTPSTTCAGTHSPCASRSCGYNLLSI